MVERQVSVDDAWKLLAAMGAGTGLVFMLRWFWWRINAWSEITAMFGSLAWFLVLQRESLQVALCGRAMVTEEQTFCVAVLTVVTWIVATYATRAESEQTLVSFYRLVHPSLLGWKHIAQLAPEVEPDRDLGLRIMAAIIGSLTIFVMLPAIGDWIFGNTLRAILLSLLTCVGFIVLFRMLRRIAPNDEAPRGR